MEFTPLNMIKFYGEAEKALAPVAEKYGVTLRFGKKSNDEYSFSTLLIGERTDAGDIQKKLFARFCEGYGLKPDDFGREFTVRGRRFVLNGISPNRPKYPIDAEEVGTKAKYKFTAEDIREKLGDK